MPNARLSQDFTNQDAIRLGTVDFEIAAVGTAAISSGALVTAGWERLGGMEPESFKPSIEIAQYNLERGFPKAAKKSFKTGQTGTLAFNLDEYTARAVQIGNGGGGLERTTDSSTTVSAAPAPTTTVFTVAGIGSIVAGSWIVHTQAGGDKFDRKVKSVSGAAITLLDPLPAAPAAADNISRVTLWESGGGGSQIQKFAGRMVFVDHQDDIVVVLFPELQFTGKWAPEFKQDAHSMLPLEATVFATKQTIGSTTDYVLLRHYMIPK